jgi:hypothetical protein
MDTINASKSIDCAADMLLNATYVRDDDTVINKYCWDSQIGTIAENTCHENWNVCNEIGSSNVSDASIGACLAERQCEFAVEMDRKQLVLFLLVILIPAGVGMWLRSRKKKQWAADLAQSIGTNSGMIVIVVALAYGIAKYPFIWKAEAKIWVCACCIGICGFVFGYQAARLCGLSVRECRTVSLETGIQNGPLAIAVAQLTFPYCSEEQFGTQDYAPCTTRIPNCSLHHILYLQVPISAYRAWLSSSHSSTPCSLYCRASVCLYSSTSDTARSHLPYSHPSIVFPSPMMAPRNRLR